MGLKCYREIFTSPHTSTTGAILIFARACAHLPAGHVLDFSSCFHRQAHTARRSNAHINHSKDEVTPPPPAPRRPPAGQRDSPARCCGENQATAGSIRPVTRPSSFRRRLLHPARSDTQKSTTNDETVLCMRVHAHASCEVRVLGSNLGRTHALRPTQQRDVSMQRWFAV